MSIDDLLTNSDAVQVYRRPLPHDVRMKIFSLDNDTCLYCNYVYPRSELEVDHVRAWSESHEHLWSNLFTACRTCNRSKGSKSILAWYLKKYGPDRGPLLALEVRGRILLLNVTRPMRRGLF